MGHNEHARDNFLRDLDTLYKNIESEEKSYLSPDASPPASLPRDIAERVFNNSPSTRRSPARCSSSSRRNPRNHRSLQLSRQVQLVLADFMLIEVEDDLLSQLQVAFVEPAPNNKRLRVVFSFPSWLWGEAIDMADVRQRLELLRSAMRGEVACVVNRKRAPELVLELLQPGEVRQ